MSSFENPLGAHPVVLVSSVGGADGARPAAAALACAGSAADRAALLLDLGGRAPRPTLLSSSPARELEERLATRLPRVRVGARGQVCQLAVAADSEGLEQASAALSIARETVSVVHVPPPHVQALLASHGGTRLTAALLRADLREDRALVALSISDLAAHGLGVAVLKRRLSWVAERRALFGALVPGTPGGLPAALVGRLLRRPEGLSTDTGFPVSAARDSSSI